MKIVKIRNILILSVFCIGLFLSGNVEAATGGSLAVFPDVQKHWAQKSINAWTERGYIGGYEDGTFRPNTPITRAEFCTFINRIFGYNNVGSFNFSDLSEEKWYTKEFGKAVAAGYLRGYPDGTVRPNSQITRMEIAVILTKILSLKYANRDVLARFRDQDYISAWGSLDVNTVVYNKYVRGYPDKTFRPNSAMTRAEAVTILDRAVGTLFDRPGIYGHTHDTVILNGNITVNTANVTLRNLVITGDLYLTEGIGDGHVSLVNVKVQGVTKVSGGVLINDCDLSSVLVDSAQHRKIRLIAQGTTKIGPTEVRTAAHIEEANLSGTGFNQVVFNVPQGSALEVQGSFRKVEVEGPKVKVQFSQGTIDTFTLALAARDAEVVINSDAHVKNLKVINKAIIKGKGTIETAEVFAKGVIFELLPHTIKVAPGANAIVNREIITGVWRLKNSASSGGTSSGGSSSSGKSNQQQSAPRFIKGYPKIVNVTPASFDLYLQTDTSCYAYYVVLEAGERAPSVKNVLAGQDAFGRTLASNYRGRSMFMGNVTISKSIRGLAEAKQYHVYFVLQSWNADAASEVTMVSATTTDSRLGSMSGIVKCNGYALQGATVFIKEGDTLLQSTITGSDGEYTFHHLDVGTYTVEFVKEGYETAQIAKVKIIGGTTKNNRDVVLYEKTGI